MIFIEKLINKKDIFVPTNDYVFKRIFGHVGNEEITKGLLKAILDLEISNIDLSGNTILEKDLADDKVGILDVKAILNNNIACDIEMQIVAKENIEDRILFYWSKMYNETIHSGEDYSSLKKCIAILIADFAFNNFNEITKSHTEWKIREKDFSKIVLTNVLELHILELPKLMDLVKNNALPTNEQHLYNWTKFLLSPNKTEVIDMENDEALKKAKQVYEDIQNDEYEQRMAELRMKNIMDKKAIEKHGYKKGLEEGIEQGIEQGSKNKQIEIAKKMLLKNKSINEIIDFTGLSQEEIENL